MRMLQQIPKVNSVDAEIMMRDFYEHEFGIYPHLSANKKRPLASVAIHPAENTIEHSLLEEAIRTFIKHNIGDMFKLSLLEFLELPMDVVQILIRVASDAVMQKNQLVSNVERELGKME